MATAGLYRRALPSPPAISFSSGEGKQLFREALQEGTMEGFFSLISHFQTQSEPAYCGLASLAMVLNALAIDPGRKWRGPWRWFDESMLDCCQPLEKVKVKGVTFGTVACLALCAGAKVEAFRTDDLTVTDFRSNIVRCASSQDIHLIASYHRRSFKQTGTGHFSPIGGYHAGKDMVLILDVARFKYPPHWVPLTLLWEAMDTIDEDTDRRRGFMVISKVQMSPCALHALSCRDESWVRMAKYLIEDIPRLLESKNLKTISEVLSLVLEALPIDCRDLLKQDSAASGEEKKNILSTEDEGRLAPKEVLQQVHETELYKRAKKYISSSMCYPENDSNGKDLFVGTLLPAESKEGDLCPSPKSLPPVNLSTFTLLLLASPPVTWSRIKHEGLLEEIQNVFSIESLPDHVKEEVLHLRMRLQFLKRCKDNEVDEEDCSHLSCCRYGR